MCSGNLQHKISQDSKCKETDIRCNEADHDSDIEIYYAEISHCLPRLLKPLFHKFQEPL
jgi:hypothetical protein